MKAPQLRTAKDDSLAPEEALDLLRCGNNRFLADVGRAGTSTREVGSYRREALSTHGQNPAAVVIACADSRCPVEILFDADPGDLFVLRNAGNTCTHAEGSIVGSTEYAVGHLGTQLVLVLGHTKCGAIAGATKTMAAQKQKRAKETDGSAADGRDDTGFKRQVSILDTMLVGLTPAAEQSESELPKGATDEEIAAHAVKVNVFHTISKLLEYSDMLREKVQEGKIQIHGAIYDLESGSVDFLGQAPGADAHPAFPGSE